MSASADSARSVAQRLRFRRSRRGQRASSRNLSLKPWTFSPIKGRCRRHSRPRHGTDHDSKPLPSFPGFCLPARLLQCRQEEHRSGRGTAQGFGRSLLALPRRFDIPLWGFSSSFHYAARRLSPLRRCGRRRSSLGRRHQTHTDQSLHALPSPLGAAIVMERDGGGISHILDKAFDAAEHVVTWGLKHRTLGQIDAIGVDEIQYSKGHRNLTLVIRSISASPFCFGSARTIESFGDSAPP